MTDIAERLRYWAAQMRVGETNIIAAHLVPHDLLEAADEIERLRAELATCRELRSLVNGDLVVARAEIARLRVRVKDLEGTLKWGQGF
jgi:hypothetical protein